MRISLVPVALAVCLLVAADSPDDAVKKELKKFDGTWGLVAGEHDGKKIADEHMKKSKIIMNDLDVTLHTPHQSSEPIKSTRKLDPSKKPGHVDVVRKTGPDAGKTMKGIYEWIDTDNYRVCIAPPGKDRPTAFKTTAGSGHTMHQWKRSKE